MATLVQEITNVLHYLLMPTAAVAASAPIILADDSDDETPPESDPRLVCARSESGVSTITIRRSELHLTAKHLLEKLQLRLLLANQALILSDEDMIVTINNDNDLNAKMILLELFGLVLELQSTWLRERNFEFLAGANAQRLNQPLYGLSILDTSDLVWQQQPPSDHRFGLGQRYIALHVQIEQWFNQLIIVLQENNLPERRAPAITEDLLNKIRGLGERACICLSVRSVFLSEDQIDFFKIIVDWYISSWLFEIVQLIPNALQNFWQRLLMQPAWRKLSEERCLLAYRSWWLRSKIEPSLSAITPQTIELLNKDDSYLILVSNLMRQSSIRLDPVPAASQAVSISEVNADHYSLEIYRKLAVWLITLKLFSQLDFNRIRTYFNLNDGKNYFYLVTALDNPAVMQHFSWQQQFELLYRSYLIALLALGPHQANNSSDGFRAGLYYSSWFETHRTTLMKFIENSIAIPEHLPAVRELFASTAAITISHDQGLSTTMSLFGILLKYGGISDFYMFFKFWANTFPETFIANYNAINYLPGKALLATTKFSDANYRKNFNGRLPLWVLGQRLLNVPPLKEFSQLPLTEYEVVRDSNIAVAQSLYMIFEVIATISQQQPALASTIISSQQLTSANLAKFTLTELWLITLIGMLAAKRAVGPAVAAASHPTWSSALNDTNSLLVTAIIKHLLGLAPDLAQAAKELFFDRALTLHFSDSAVLPGETLSSITFMRHLTSNPELYQIFNQLIVSFDWKNPKIYEFCLQHLDACSLEMITNLIDHTLTTEDLAVSSKNIFLLLRACKTKSDALEKIHNLDQSATQQLAAWKVELARCQATYCSLLKTIALAGSTLRELYDEVANLNANAQLTGKQKRSINFESYVDDKNKFLARSQWWDWLQRYGMTSFYGYPVRLEDNDNHDLLTAVSSLARLQDYLIAWLAGEQKALASLDRDYFENTVIPACGSPRLQLLREIFTTLLALPTPMPMLVITSDTLLKIEKISGKFGEYKQILARNIAQQTEKRLAEEQAAELAARAAAQALKEAELMKPVVATELSQSPKLDLGAGSGTTATELEAMGSLPVGSADPSALMIEDAELPAASRTHTSQVLIAAADLELDLSLDPNFNVIIDDRGGPTPEHMLRTLDLSDERGSSASASSYSAEADEPRSSIDVPVAFAETSLPWADSPPRKVPCVIDQDNVVDNGLPYLISRDGKSHISKAPGVRDHLSSLPTGSRLALYMSPPRHQSTVVSEATTVPSTGSRLATYMGWSLQELASRAAVEVPLLNTEVPQCSPVSQQQQQHQQSTPPALVPLQYFLSPHSLPPAFVPQQQQQFARSPQHGQKQTQQSQQKKAPQSRRPHQQQFRAAPQQQVYQQLPPGLQQPALAGQYGQLSPQQVYQQLPPGLQQPALAGQHGQLSQQQVYQQLPPGLQQPALAGQYGQLSPQQVYQQLPPGLQQPALAGQYGQLPQQQVYPQLSPGLQRPLLVQHDGRLPSHHMFTPPRSGFVVHPVPPNGIPAPNGVPITNSVSSGNSGYPGYVNSYPAGPRW